MSRARDIADGKFANDLTVDTNTLHVDAANNRVGIGTTNPTNSLEVSGSGTASRITSSTDNVYLRLSNAQDTGGYLGYESSVISLWTGNSRRIRVDSDGLKFGSDTAAANALSDYEEGTWTPNWAQGITSPGYLVQQGYYVKIGRLVTASCYLRSNTGTATSAHVYIGGLPFRVTNSYTSVDGAYWTYNGGFYTADEGSTWLAFQNSTSAGLYRATDGAALGGTSTGVASNLNADVRVKFIYETDL